MHGGRYLLVWGLYSLIFIFMIDTPTYLIIIIEGNSWPVIVEDEVCTYIHFCFIISLPTLIQGNSPILQSIYSGMFNVQVVLQCNLTHLNRRSNNNNHNNNHNNNNNNNTTKTAKKKQSQNRIIP